MNILELSSLKETSSLLFPSKEEQDHWFKKVRENPSKMVEDIRQEAKKLLNEVEPTLDYSLFIQYQKTGSRLEYERVYFARRRRLNTFAMMLLVEPENLVYRDALQNTIWSICEESTWCLPAHLGNLETEPDDNLSLPQETAREKRWHSIDLFASETAFALSEIYQLTEQWLDPIVGRRIHEEVYRRIFWPFHHGSFHWETATHNWASVCAGSIGAAALYIIKDKEELAMTLERVIRTMDHYLEGFYEDGACLEGYEYWQYGFGFYVYFADLLKKKTAGAINLFQSKKVHQIALFEQKSFLHKNVIVNFSDSVPRASVFLGLSHYLHRLYPDVQIPERDICANYTDDPCSRWAPAIRNLIWVAEDIEGNPWEDGTYYLPEAQWFISRVSNQGQAYAFATKGGHNDEPHNHNDLGHFMLFGGGDVFLQDLGSGEYTKKYFGPERYSYMSNGSQGHSVPIINHHYQHEGASYAASDLNVRTEDDGRSDIVELEISGAYKVESLKRLVRMFTWEKREKPILHLEDSYTFDKDLDSIVERFITPIFVIKEDNDGIVLVGTKQKLRISYDKEVLECKKTKQDFSNHHGKLEEFVVLDFRVKNIEKKCTVNLKFQFE
ncbi:heparinase II/III family protein [Bacillus solitudinis]|uniref:heparinase II/III family protein n=1 Tax=Bacillus solitudinis TaxID=2014074 RepID=UPI000C2332EF|nr:heparinase II/III family protein [Bacillus solitudinis]